MSLQMNDLLRSMVQKGASDLHVKAGSPPGFRIDGEVHPAPDAVVGPRVPEGVIVCEYLPLGDADLESIAHSVYSRAGIGIVTARRGGQSRG